jgi:hypothetical protein
MSKGAPGAPDPQYLSSTRQLRAAQLVDKAGSVRRESELSEFSCDQCTVAAVFKSRQPVSVTTPGHMPGDI